LVPAPHGNDNLSGLDHRRQYSRYLGFRRREQDGLGDDAIHGVAGRGLLVFDYGGQGTQ